MTASQRAALTACAVGPLAHRPWRAALADLPAVGSRTDECGFPAVPDAAFPLFRAAAARLLDPAAFTRVDAVYRATYVRARGHAAALRHASGGNCTGAVLQQLTINAASADEVLTRLRAAQAGLFADGLLLDLRPGRHPPWELRAGCLRPRLDHSTVARLRGLADPVVAAAVTLARATAMTPAQLCALRRRDVTGDGARLRVRAGRLTYRIPARAAGPVRAAVLHQPPAPDGGLASAAGQAPLLATFDGAPISETALQRLRHHGAAWAGIALPAGSFRDWVITDLCAPSRVRP
jgi:integrase